MGSLSLEQPARAPLIAGPGRVGGDCATSSADEDTGPLPWGLLRSCLKISAHANDWKTAESTGVKWTGAGGQWDYCFLRTVTGAFSFLHLSRGHPSPLLASSPLPASIPELWLNSQETQPQGLRNQGGRTQRPC